VKLGALAETLKAAPKAEPVPAAVAAPAATSSDSEPVQNGHEAPWGGPTDDVRQFFRAIVGPVEGRINEADVRRIAGEVAAEAVAKVAMPERVIIVKESKPEERQDLGLQHFKFPLLLKVLEAGMHAYLVGPAGTGKTTAAHQAEKALTLGSYECQSFYGTMTATTLLGYKDANGNYHDTPLRRAYEQGGLWCADEVDAGVADDRGGRRSLHDGHVSGPPWPNDRGRISMALRLAPRGHGQSLGVPPPDG